MMRLNKIVTAFAAATMAVAPIAASANPAAMLSVGSVQESEAGAAGGGGVGTGTVLAVLLVMVAVGVGVASSGGDSPDSP